MFFPVKIKALARKQTSLVDILSSDPQKKLKALNAIRIGRVYKTTGSNRFPLTIEYLVKKDSLKQWML